MAKNNMPKKVRDKIFKVVYKKADEFGYIRLKSDLLLDHPPVDP